MQTVKLSDVCTIVSGSTPKTDEPAFWNGTLKWVTPAELRDDTIFVTDTERHITEAAARSAHLTPFPAGTVLLSSRAPIGKTAIAGAEMYCNQGFKNLICSDRINNRYLYYFLTSRTRYLNDLGRGATFKEISKTIVENIEIPLPPLAEQQRIVRELQQVGALLANRRQVDEQLAELPKARFVEMFGDPVVNPMGWEVVPFTTCATIDTNMVQDFTGYEDFPHIGIDSIEKNTGKILAYRTIREDRVISGKYLFTPKHIIYSKIRPNLNKVALPTFDGLCSADAYPILPNAENCNRIYLAYMLRSKRFLNYILAFSSRTNMPKVNRKQVEGFRLPLPPLPAQRRFAAFARACAAQRAACARQIAVLETLRGKLLQDAFGAAG